MGSPIGLDGKAIGLRSSGAMGMGGAGGYNVNGLGFEFEEE